MLIRQRQLGGQKNFWDNVVPCVLFTFITINEQSTRASLSQGKEMRLKRQINHTLSDHT